MSSNPYNHAFNSIYSQESVSNDAAAHNDIDDQEQLNPQNQDTFLSRIFGLNSIYNQMQDNYQYYDPEFDTAFNNNNGDHYLATTMQQAVQMTVAVLMSVPPKVV